MRVKSTGGDPGEQLNDVFLKFPTRHSAVPLRAILPNMITSVALACGLASIHFAMQSKWENALIAIALSAVFDALDGRAARLMRVTSKFGAVLDSLSDFASFGIAPAVLLYQWMLRDSEAVRPEPLFMMSVLTFAMCSAMRLARFTSAKPAKKGNPFATRFFVGMPTPAAAGAVLLPVLVSLSPSIHWPMPPIAIAIYIFFVGALMVSRVPMYSFKKIRIHPRAVVPLFIGVGLLVFLAAKDTWLVAIILAGGYLLSVPLACWSHYRLKRQLAEQAFRMLEGHDAMIEPDEKPPSRLKLGRR
ncbi:MAG: phosphatidylcholine/phosphatidylserine synthase [Phycisphaeraceae bacterium]|nr:phosphatidylcholine/phosphatidylserine synthase [Phycisphaeraceae bacterium]